MGNQSLVEAAVIILFVLMVIALPYFCCQISNEEYRKITKRMQEIKLEQLRKQAQEQSKAKEGDQKGVISHQNLKED